MPVGQKQHLKLHFLVWEDAMDRVNKFIEIYKTCSNGTNEEKYLRIKNGELTLPRYVDVELTNMCTFLYYLRSNIFCAIFIIYSLIFGEITV